MNDVLGAVFDFLVSPMMGGLDGSAIVRGWQNHAVLPDTNEYTVLTLIGVTRRGTNVHDLSDTASTDADTGDLYGTESVHMLTLYDVQVDFCGTDEAPVAYNAAALCALARDGISVEFFERYGLSCQYADDPKPLPFSNDQNQWTIRYSVTLHLSGYTTLTLPVPLFTAVNVNLENVDVGKQEGFSVSAES